MNVHGPIVPVDVVVVGAGAAGLAAARCLYERDVDVIVLEASERIGGRAYTLQTHDGRYPVELGAEFIHGKADATMALLRESGSGTLEIPDTPAEIWEATERVLDRVDLDGRDMSVDAFLKSTGMPEAEDARMLIEGFDAAITADTSIISIAKEWRSEVNDTQSRPRDGYGMLMRTLAKPLGDRLWLNAPVCEIHWNKDGADVCCVRSGEPVRVHAKRAIVTLPIGVLRENAVQFVPPLPPEKRKAVDAIGMGPVVKVVLEFRSVFWDDGFVETPDDCAFPTLWSRLPQAAPVLVAWAGGDAATRLLSRFSNPIVPAIDVCAKLFPKTDIRAELVKAHYHDWQRDPYARGAYSYLRVDGGDARERLAEPLDAVLFFAGEAACAEDAGTVGGALESGYRVATEVASSASGRPSF